MAPAAGERLGWVCFEPALSGLCCGQISLTVPLLLMGNTAGWPAPEKVTHVKSVMSIAANPTRPAIFAPRVHWLLGCAGFLVPRQKNKNYHA